MNLANDDGVEIRHGADEIVGFDFRDAFYAEESTANDLLGDGGLNLQRLGR